MTHLGRQLISSQQGSNDNAAMQTDDVVFSDTLEARVQKGLLYCHVGDVSGSLTVLLNGQLINGNMLVSLYQQLQPVFTSEVSCAWGFTIFARWVVKSVPLDHS